MDEKSKLKNDWKMTDEEMGNTNVPVIINTAIITEMFPILNLL